MLDLTKNIKVQNFLHDEENKQTGSKTSQDLKLQSEEALVIEDLFGKVLGIERVLLVKKKDTLRDVIEKITLIPENKLVFMDVE